MFRTLEGICFFGCLLPFVKDFLPTGYSFLLPLFPPTPSKFHFYSHNINQNTILSGQKIHTICSGTTLCHVLQSRNCNTCATPYQSKAGTWPLALKHFSWPMQTIKIRCRARSPTKILTTWAEHMFGPTLLGSFLTQYTEVSSETEN